MEEDDTNVRRCGVNLVPEHHVTSFKALKTRLFVNVLMMTYRILMY